MHGQKHIKIVYPLFNNAFTL